MCKDCCNTDLRSNNSGNRNDLSAVIVSKKKKRTEKILGFFSLEQNIYLFIYLFVCVCVCVFKHNHDRRMIWGLLAMDIFTAGKDSVCAYIFIYNCD